MKTVKSNNMIYKILFLLVFTIITIQGFAQEFTYANVVERRFVVQKNATIDIYNKYGKIHLISWEKDSVYITIDYEIKANKVEKLEKMKTDLEFEFVPSQFYLTAKTQIGKRANDIMSSINDIVSLSGNSVMINYTVYVPENVNLKIENKFGDVYIDDVKGNLNLKLSNGDLKINRLEGTNNELDLSFGDATFNYINSARITCLYEDVYVKKSNKLIVNSKSSKITLDYIDNLKTNSKRDNFYIGNLMSLYGESTFSDFSIRDFSTEIIFDFKYGDVDIDNIQADFVLIKASSKYTDIKLFFEKTSAYSVDITHKYLELTYPKEISEISEKISEDTKTNYVYGTIGNGSKKSKISLTAENGSLNLIQK
ncbi:MAG TPA: hypothetical protein DDX39_12300 [Bacteroidales bacterium]|nr:MAG: hypothetical protein A2W98_11705 [Bacteroidetes bacterium GWF2_33_38]OFY68645.1 MAG: hypothetical protein A2265_02895 [Bacteroidetes bacterium RIFOXYA12_FULL_33_9]OFY88828.1 MAG: hypothetical protein A2236_08435 [Bacteroidetes bacterium RIFOXYA2_FULL_33_7]HBF89414.1 hypothetical protein [Bacteroidales bacterium]